jgi:hypothetical protein
MTGGSPPQITGATSDDTSNNGTSNNLVTD